MFTPEHEISKIAFYFGESDDWLPYAEELVHKWAHMEPHDIRLSGFDLSIAAVLLKDDLLPSPARWALGELMLKVQTEAKARKLTIECLGIKAPRPGRKNEPREVLGFRLKRVHQLLKEGKTKTEAYEITAKEQFKSPDTIRREYERHVLTKKNRRITGKIKQ